MSYSVSNRRKLNRQRKVTVVGRDVVFPEVLVLGHVSLAQKEGSGNLKGWRLEDGGYVLGSPFSWTAGSHRSGRRGFHSQDS